MACEIRKVEKETQGKSIGFRYRSNKYWYNKSIQSKVI